MTYSGTVQNGVIVLSAGQILPEGSVVQVAVQSSPSVAKEDAPESIWMDLARLGQEVDSIELDLPEDLAINHDHYLYGAPKRQ